MWDEEGLEDASSKEFTPPTPISVSLNSFVGIDNPKKMKLRGIISGHSVVVMINPGATHIFVSNKTMKKLGLVVEATGEFDVTLGTGKEILGQGVCKKVTVKLEGLIISEDFFPLELKNSDLIMGTQWLEKLETVTTNWKIQEIDGEWESDIERRSLIGQDVGITKKYDEDTA